MYSLMVGPDQFTDIYTLGEECARRLGIGIPRIFISPIDQPNAFTISTNDVEPMVILTRKLVEILTEEELLFVIGHECGHIHNFHGIYNTAAVMLVNPTMRVALEKLVRVGTPLGVVRMVASAVQGSLRLFLLNWSRCAEITADRAGLICCGDPKAAERALLKLIVGDEGLLDRMNVEAYVEQIGQTQQLSMAARIRDMENSHPLVPQRIKALRIFAVTDAFHSWRPDVTGQDVQYSKAEADHQCEQLIGGLA
jgi:Zn-dependent protease with chaperone function